VTGCCDGIENKYCSKGDLRNAYRSDNGVLGFDWLASNRSTAFARKVGLLYSGVDGLETFQPLLEFIRETVIRFDLAEEESITSNIGLVLS